MITVVKLVIFGLAASQLSHFLVLVYDDWLSFQSFLDSFALLVIFLKGLLIIMTLPIYEYNKIDSIPKTIRITPAGT